MGFAYSRDRRSDQSRAVHAVQMHSEDDLGAVSAFEQGDQGTSACIVFPLGMSTRCGPTVRSRGSDRSEIVAAVVRTMIHCGSHHMDRSRVRRSFLVTTD